MFIYFIFVFQKVLKNVNRFMAVEYIKKIFKYQHCKSENFSFYTQPFQKHCF